jgi:hypothetical protein
MRMRNALTSSETLKSSIAKLDVKMLQKFQMKPFQYEPGKTLKNYRQNRKCFPTHL